MSLRSAGLSVALVLVMAVTAAGGYTSNIMLTGYWPPSNEMIRPFSANPEQNPSGWIGGNWEGRGYNIYSYFPEFTSPPPGDNIGHGDFEVDYQSTLGDFSAITEEIHPVAIVTFGRGSPGLDWEIESRYRNLSGNYWQNDYRWPYKPTPSPPDSSLPGGAMRYSSLPMESIMNSVNDAGLGVTSFIDTTGDAGAFLCEYIGYHAAWYHDRHADPADDFWNIAGGHIHVGTDVTVAQATLATEVTLRALTDYLNTFIPEPATAAILALLVIGCRRR
jgi:hypothetical protein